MSDAIAMQFVSPVAPEDQARANLYGLLARLFYAPPDANLISELRLAVPPPGDGERLVATGRAIRSGRTLTVCEVEVNAFKGGTGTPCARVLQTLMCLEGRPDGPREPILKGNP